MATTKQTKRPNKKVAPTRKPVAPKGNKSVASRKVPAKKAPTKPRRAKHDCPECAGSGVGMVSGVRAGVCDNCGGKGKV